MKIVKELNLNKTPQGAQIGSMIFAKNIKLTLDKQAITSEEGLKRAINNTQFIRQGNSVLGVISNGADVVVFGKYNGVASVWYGHITNISSKDYDLFLSKSTVSWTHEGGEVFGIVTRNNKGDLIVAVSERNTSNEVPLKILNLSTGATANSTEVSPEVPFGNLRFASDTHGGLIPSGLYYFFIRFEIDNGVWSKWQPLAHPKIAISSQYKTVIQHRYNHRINFQDNGALLSNNPTAEEIEVINKKSINVNSLSVRIPYNDVLYDSDTCFNMILKVYNGDVAKNAQIGYILQHENGSFGRLWIEFPISDSNTQVFNFQFDAKWTKEISIDDFLENAFSIKNVENIAEFQGRLYVSNFKESDYNVDEDYVDCTITFGPSSTKYVDAGFSSNIDKKSGKGNFMTIYNTITNVKIPYGGIVEKYYLKGYENDVIYEQVHSGFASIMYDQEFILTVGNYRYKSFFDLIYRSGVDKYGEGWINERDYLIAVKRSGEGMGPDDYYFVKVSDVCYDSAALAGRPDELYHSIEDPENYGDSAVNNFLIYNGTDAHNPDGFNLGSSYHRFAVLKFNNDIKGIAVVDANTQMLNGRIVSPKAVLDMSFIQYDKLEGTDGRDCLLVANTIASSTPKDIKSIRSFLPFNTYRFFCHFVRKDGSYTNGILMRSGNAHTSTFKSDPVGVDLANVGFAIRPIVVQFSNIIIPDGYVGYFVSYQTYIDNFGYTGYVLRDVSHSFYGTSTDAAQVGRDKNSRSDPNPASTSGFGSNRYHNEHSSTPGTTDGDSVIGSYNNNLALIKASDVESHIVSFKATKAYQLFTNNSISDTHADVDIDNPILISGDNTGDGKTIYDSIGGNSGVSCKLASSIVAGSTVVTHYNNTTGSEKAPLEKLTDIIYNSSSCNENNCDFNYPGFVTIHNFIEYLQPVYIDEEGRVFKYSSTGAIENIIIDDELYAQANYVVGYSRYDLNAISIKRQPEILVGLLNSVAGIQGGVFGSSSTIKELQSGEKTVTTVPNEDQLLKVKQQNLIYRPINLIDLFEYKNDFIEKKYKQYIINNKDKVKNYKSVNIIRRSNVMATESDENGWNKFDANNYFVLTKNKGAITNLIVLHNQLIAHTEQSMFVFNGDNTIEQAAGNALQITSADIFALTPTEIFADNYGYGGLQIRNISAVNYAGYWFVDSNSKKLFVFNNNIADATYNFINVLEDYEIVDGCIASDIINDRILVCLALEKTITVDVLADENDPTSITQEPKTITNYVTMSFDISSKKLISLHDYKFNKSINVSGRCYLASLDVNNTNRFEHIDDLFMFTPKEIFGNYSDLENDVDYEDDLFLTIDSEDEAHSHKCSIVDVIFNHNYEQPKVLNSLRWIVDRIDLYGALPHDKLAEYVSDNQTNDIIDIKKYPGYKLRVYTDSTDTQNINLVGTHPVINKMDDYKVPHYEKGVWYFNYFRNYLNDVALVQDIHRWYALIKDTELVKYIPLDQNGTYAATYDKLTSAQKAKLQQIKASMSFSDNRSLIYGKYFVVRFIFDMGTENKPFKLENVDVNTTIA